MKFSSPMQHIFSYSIPSLSHISIRARPYRGLGLSAPCSEPLLQLPVAALRPKALLVLKCLSCKNYATETTPYPFDIALERSQASLKGLLALGSLVTVGICKKGQNLKCSRPHGQKSGSHQRLHDFGINILVGKESSFPKPGLRLCMSCLT